MTLGAQQSATSIGLRLKATRLALGFHKQKEFAATFGATAQQLSNYEKGQNRPDVWEMIQLSLRHGISLDWIYLNDPYSLRYGLAVKILECLETLEAEAAGESRRERGGARDTR